MKIALKRTLIILLSALLVFSCAILLLNPFNVYALDSATDVYNVKVPADNAYKIESPDFKIEEYVTVDDKAFASNKYKFSQGITLNNPDYTNDMYNMLNDTVTNWIGTKFYLNHEIKLIFLVYREKVDGKQMDLLREYQIVLDSNSSTSYFDKIIRYKDYSYFDEVITFGDDKNPIDNIEYPNGIDSIDFSSKISKYTQNGYSILCAGSSKIGFPTTKQSQTIPITIETSSATVNYRVKFFIEKNIDTVTQNNFWGFKSEKRINLDETAESVIYGHSQSIRNGLRYCKNKDEANFNSLYSSYGADVLERANQTINNEKTFTIKLRYLEQIGDTPFAKPKYTTIDVKTVDNKVVGTDILATLDIEKFECLDAHGESVEIKEGANSDGSDLWVVEYYKSSWLRAKTTSGNYLDYFFDINKSYKEFYDVLIDAGHVREDCYEYCLNEILKKYPELTEGETQSGLNPEELYGCWGYVVMPTEIGFDQMFKDIFNVGTTVGEQMISFSYQHQLSKEEYSKLVESQDYSVIEHFWYNISANATGSYEATTYLMIMPSGVSWIDDSGQIKDEEGAKNPEQDGVLGGAVSGGATAIGGALKGAFDSFIGLFKGLTGSPLALAGTMGVLVLGVVVFILIKTGAFKNIGSGNPRPPRPKAQKRRKK